MNKLFLILFLNSFIFFSHAEDNMNIDCRKVLNPLISIKINLEKKFKELKDINIEYNQIEQAHLANPNCHIWDKLKVKEVKLRAYKKSIFSPDKSFELKEEKCSTVDISTKHMPKNNSQGSLSWCFAWSATDLLSFNEEIPLSSYDTASQYHLFSDERKNVLKKKSNPNFADEAGVSEDTLKIIVNGKGVCTEEDTNLANGDWSASNTMIADIISPDKSFREVLCKYDSFNIDSIRHLSTEVMDALDKLTSDKKLGAFFDLFCPNRHTIKKKYEVKSLWTEDKKVSAATVMSQLDQVLEVNHQPVSAGYTGSILRNGQNFVGKPSHYSTIIGRKFNKATSQCEYLIKNSYGITCENVAPSIKCEQGNYWVPRTLLQKNIEDINWLEPK